MGSSTAALKVQLWL